MEQLLGKIVAVKGIIHGHAYGVVTAQRTLMVKLYIMEIRGWVTAYLAGAGIAQVGVAGRIVGHNVYDAVIKGADDALRRGIFLQVHRIYRQILIVLIALVGNQSGIVGIVCIGAAACWAWLIHLAVFYNRYIQQFYKLGVPYAQSDIEILIVVSCALEAGKAAPVAVGVHCHVQ